MLKKVALIGRTNVGKSTLFNRLSKKRIAIVEDQPRITRDFIEQELEWEGVRFILEDTGGWDFVPHREIDRLVTEKSQQMLEEADLVVLVIDGQIGVTTDDLEVSRKLRKLKKDVILVVNKIDTPEQKEVRYDYQQLGIRDCVHLSAVHGRNVTELFELILEKLALSKMEHPAEVEQIKVAICGIPNVGKSSLCNRIIGRNRSIVHAEPGTTRDAIDTPVKYRKKEILLIDTAGIRRRSKVHENVEFYSVNRAHHAIDRADVVVLVLDAESEVSHHEQTLAGYLKDNFKCLVIALNKWDLVKDKENTYKKKLEEIERRLKFYAFVPVVTISALDGQRVNKLMDTVLEVQEAKQHFIDPSELKEEIRRALIVQDLSIKGKGLIVKTVKQSPWRCPTFDIGTNLVEKMPVNARRYFERIIRELYPFAGCPLRLIFK
ncbi:MAG: ribosome biogenesis GTPase Der [Candidatus Wallbacteria bacterium]|nr:ribosome biogenesis GTPase Der [Candidatus Wallbacteria bacterium]